MYKSEIRDSTVQELIEKVRKRNYGTYLVSIWFEKIRMFRESRIDFGFPVTALIGPNGSGKSTIRTSACIYASIDPQTCFRKSSIGDECMDDWRIEYEVVDRNINPRGTIRAEATFKENEWSRNRRLQRSVRIS